MNFLASHLITVKVKLFEYIAVCFSFSFIQHVYGYMPDITQFWQCV